MQKDYQVLCNPGVLVFQLIDYGSTKGFDSSLNPSVGNSDLSLNISVGDREEEYKEVLEFIFSKDTTASSEHKYLFEFVSQQGVAPTKSFTSTEAQRAIGCPFFNSRELPVELRTDA